MYTIRPGKKSERVPFSIVRPVQKIRDVATSKNQTGTSNEPDLTVGKA